ncbi:hypothetical protein LUZ60_001312 [Juncus effusus]|nr:hypothetical protein LUZ60_001312 [Juncus effusus]
MARIPRSRRPSTRHIRSSSFPSIPSYRWPRTKSAAHQSHSSISHKNHHHRCDWKDATCSVCMDSPHNAVLLLCSSHEKGCRPYMCATSFRHSNCLDQFKKAYSKSHAPGSPWTESDKLESSELTCPLCRGQVKGWTIVEPAREFLNLKKRNCMQDGCNFVGTYKELRKHVKCEHPSAKPREVDPTLEQKWRNLEHERERQDVISTIRSSMPRAVVFGDYVIEMGESDDSDNDDVVGDVGGEDERVGYDDVAEGARGGVNRSILYFFLREGSRFMRGQGDDVARHTFFDDDDEGEDEGEDDDVAGEGRGAGPFGLERRRRRRRSRVRFV